MSIQEKLTTAAANVPKVYEAGVAEGRVQEQSDFWDIYQDYGNRRHWQYAFCSTGWTDETYDPKYPIIIDSNVEAGTYAGYRPFNSSLITSTKVPIIAKGAHLDAPFMGSSIQTVVYLEVDANTTFNNFGGATLTPDINIVGEIADNITLSSNWKLNKASIIKFVNCLSTNTEGLSITFSNYAVNKAFETSEGAMDGSTSAEWQALIAPKTNWHIVL